MRMWMVPPVLMCSKHLLGEHFETHMFAGSLRLGKSIQGYVDRGLVETRSLPSRHDALALEMGRRGMQHRSPFPSSVLPLPNMGTVDYAASHAELIRRCPPCWDLWAKAIRDLKAAIEMEVV